MQIELLFCVVSTVPMIQITEKQHHEIIPNVYNSNQYNTKSMISSFAYLLPSPAL
jgi:uncharacterized Fe-S radical SAM superfamily protein PflX